MSGKMIKRNLANCCKTCEDNDKSLMWCCECCGVPLDLLRDIESERIREESTLDRIRTQITSNLKGVNIALDVLDESSPLRPKMEGAKDTLVDCLDLIDKYELETETEDD